NPDPLGTKAHRRLDGPFHRPAERHAALELLRDRLGDQRRINLGLPHLDDVDVNLRVGHRGDLLAELLDVGALLADDDAGTSRVYRHARLLVWPLDDDLRHCRLLEVFHQRLADGHVLVQQLAVLALVRVPARIPGAIDAEPEPDRIYFLTHQA